MKKYIFLTSLFCVLAILFVSAQEVLPGITVKDFNGKIIVSWQNAYNVPVSNISIQRSYDSTRNFSTIGTVLNPQNLENGFADDKPPYNKMYYRVFISFEGGSYLFSSVVRPVRETPLRKGISINHVYTPDPEDSSAITEPALSKKDNQVIISTTPRFPWQGSPLMDSIARINAKIDSIHAKNNEPLITYPSQRIYTGRENNLVIHLTDAAIKKYTVKFYNEADSFLFELSKLKEEYLIIEKVNFVRSGWYHFELFENGKLVEKNKFYIGKDGKSAAGELNRRSNK